MVMSDSVMVPSLTQEQYTQLLSMLKEHQDKGHNAGASISDNTIGTHAVMSAQTQQTSASGKYKGNTYCESSIVWILDSGATDHICSSICMFESFKPVSSVYVKLPNDHNASVTHIGTVRVTPNLILQDVFFIPTFTFNLISISKLTQHNLVTITFDKCMCLIQEKVTGKMIGSAERRKGLYYLRANTNHASNGNCFNVQSSTGHATDGMLWHMRLGHMGIDRMKDVHKQQPSVVPSIEYINCDVCPLAKQKRLPFPVSASHSSSPFDLIHIDIWGPYKYHIPYLV